MDTDIGGCYGKSVQLGCHNEAEREGGVRAGCGWEKESNAKWISRQSGKDRESSRISTAKVELPILLYIGSSSVLVMSMGHIINCELPSDGRKVG